MRASLNLKYLYFFVVFLFTGTVYAEVLPPGYAVASANPVATRVGMKIMQQGGNAFDAAVAVSAVLAVVEPYHSSIGGGGFWLLHVSSRNKNVFIDGREVAPKAATEDMYWDEQGQPIPDLSLNGPLAAAIPGEPAALAYISRKYGKLSLEKALQPAIELAENGYRVDHHFQHFLTMGDRQKQLQRYPASAKIFLKEGKRPYEVGEMLYQTDLAKTLKKFAKEGHNGFYHGEIAHKLVSAVKASGGIWSLKDLADYRVKVRAPLEGSFHNMQVVTAPLPSAGGISILTMLGILEAYPLKKLTEIQSIHYVVEAMRMAFWQRSLYLGDPDFVQVPVKELLSVKNISLLRSLILKDKATPSSELFQKNENSAESSNTTHFSIIDHEGNRVAATLTVNYIFGSSFTAQGTGVLLNDEMNDFALKPKTKNVFGLIAAKKNKIEPEKRPLSSMSPTFLELPDRVAILGTPGGSRIPTMVLLSALKFYESFGAITMVSNMRFHHQFLPDQITFEPNTFSVETQKKLVEMGYKLDPLKQYYGDMQAISWDKTMKLITSASDPRHIGLGAKHDLKNQDGYGLGW